MMWTKLLKDNFIYGKASTIDSRVINVVIFFGVVSTIITFMMHGFEYVSPLATTLMLFFWMTATALICFAALSQRAIFDREKKRADNAIQEMNRLIELRVATNSVAMILLSADASKGDSLKKSLKILAEGFKVDDIRIWRSISEDEDSITVSMFECYVATDNQEIESKDYTMVMPKTEDVRRLLSSETNIMVICKNDPDIPKGAKAPLKHFNMESAAVVPIITNGEIWGFISFSVEDCSLKLDENEEVVLHSAVMILSASIILQQTLSDLVSAREQALIGLKAKSEFLASMSHEIRTPISAIIGMTNLALADGDQSDNNIRLNKIKEASIHLMGVINDILDMSKIESGKFTLHAKPFFTRPLIDRTLSIVRFRAEERYQTLINHVDPRLPERLIGDEQRLAQVIMNLLSNAVKFTPEEGTIELGCEVKSTTKNSCKIMFSVKDDGIGIDPEKQEKLFESFEQVDSGATRRHGGTGLGLAISKRIVDGMGGTFTLESSLGKGSTFSFIVELPVYSENGFDINYEDEADKEIKAIKDLIEKRMLDLSHYQVLVVEDIDVNYEILSALLEPTAIKLHWAQDGKQALLLYEENHEQYDLVLMDLQMPEMNGFEATKNIRKSGKPNATKIPIIAMTANVMDDDVAMCYQSGMNGHLSKPLDILQLIGALKFHLNISAPE